MRQLFRYCLDRRVLSALAAFGVAVWLVAPTMIGPLIPALIILACPVSMAVMAWMMRPGQAAGRDGTRDMDAVRAEMARLDARKAELEVELAAGSSSRPGAAPTKGPGLREMSSL